MREYKYNRTEGLKYAHEWAFGRNPKYYDFSSFGGDCTNFISQCLYAGCNTMNYNKYGWYYISSYNRSASWTGVDFLYDFLINNNGKGPYARVVSENDIEKGDIIQLSFSNVGRFNHSLFVVETGSIPTIDNILIATHTYDRDYYPVKNYAYSRIRFLKILGYRK